MSTLKIIINLSAEVIEMAYTTEKSKGRTLPLPGGIWPVSVAKFTLSSNPRFDGVFCLEVIKRIEKFLDSYTESEDEELRIDNVDIVCIVENDISDETAHAIENDFRIRGVKVKMCRPDLLVSEYFRREHAFRGIVIADSNGIDLYLSVALSSRPGEIARRELPGLGADPRIRGLAEKIWEVVSDQTIDMDMEREMRALMATAEKFIELDRAEKDMTILLSDGQEYDVTVYRSMVPRDESRILEAEYTGFLGSAANLSDHSESVLVFRRQVCDSLYLRQLLSPAFKEVAEDKGSLHEALIRLAISSDAPEFMAHALQEDKGDNPLQSDEEKNKIGRDEPKVSVRKELMPVSVEAEVQKVKAGLFKKKNVLRIKITSPGNPSLKWHSVLCVQEKPLSVILDENIVKDFDRGDKLPFMLEFPLPLTQCPDAKRLRIYFKPHPDEPIGINNAYECAPCTINL